MGACGATRLTFMFLMVATTAIVVAGASIQPVEARGQAPREPSAGRKVYDTACAACHGADGRGTAPTFLGFDTPVPDFTDCSFVSVEPTADWMAITHDGGPVRGFSRRMPAFGAALNDTEREQAIDYIRGFCTNTAWPRGELNMPRPLVTEKAYPENEAVLTTTIAASETGAVGNEFLYEKRMGSRSQFEVVVPLEAQQRDDGAWQQGLGDVAFAVKHALYHSLNRGHILSLAGEIVFPTGKEDEGLGKGVTVFEPFVTFGQLLPADGFVQAQVGFELPTDTEKAEQEAFWRVAIGKSFTQGRFGRSWSPMVELLAARELEVGATTDWDLVPQMQITLNQRQHLMINAGVRIPLNDRSGRSTQVITYFLWDWFDGGLRDGW
jgi:mono/diheme cytochrome c family protein